MQALRDRGWQPLPFTEFVLKVHSRCNLACDYCYMYEMADQSWLRQPKVISADVIDATCRSIAEHVAEYAIPQVSIVLHGGEPLLAGHQVIESAARRLHEHLADETILRLGIQTNGLLLDQEFLDIFKRWDIKVGVSLDGSEAGHDRHRKYRNGQGSHAQVIEKLRLLTEDANRSLYGGLLCVIDLENDPLETYKSLAVSAPPAIDFLLPHGNWDSPPPGRTSNREDTLYADWLIPIFDYWYESMCDEPSVRLFDDIMDIALGTDRASETVGLAPIQVVVIETDGQIEQVDTLKSAFPDATKLGEHVSRSRLSSALWSPGVVARQIGVAALGPACLKCPIRNICGGGNFTHRYRAETGFRNPSVYCSDLFKLINHITQRLYADMVVPEGNGATR
ncbi:FxsB family cyclophane-forming radical SAM/SPASM peptide maturase [Nocardia sp. NPDC051990]|uniref:FxsB family cyclophane-forming radical SAM/SPASM peptide maturase n=1 Tax=Nocardia sp. NPDC051990 TaxID=3155285 RepID=UPI0034283342